MFALPCLDYSLCLSADPPHTRDTAVNSGFFPNPGSPTFPVRVTEAAKTMRVSQ